MVSTRTSTTEHIVSINAAVVSRRSIRRRNKEERGNRDTLLGVFAKPWNLQEGRVELDPNSVAHGGNIPMVNPEVEG